MTRRIPLILVALAWLVPGAHAAGPTIVGAKVAPSQQLLYVEVRKADGSPAKFAISAVRDGATITRNGVTTPLTKPISGEYTDRVMWPFDRGLWNAWLPDDGASFSKAGEWTAVPSPYASGQSLQVGKPGSSCTFKASVPRAGRYILRANLWDFVGPDRTADAVYTVRQGATVAGTLRRDLTKAIYPLIDLEDAGYLLTDLGQVELKSAGDATITLTSGVATGLLVADAVRLDYVPGTFMSPGDAVSAAFPAGTVIVSGTPTDAATLPVTIATEDEVGRKITPPAERRMKLGYNIAGVRQELAPTPLADRGYASDIWQGSCTLDAHYDMATCSGPVKRPLLYGDWSGDRGMSLRGINLLDDGDIKVEFDPVGTFDDAARSRIGLTGTGYEIGAAQWKDLGAGRWRMTQPVKRKPWRPMSTRTEPFDPRWVRDLTFESHNPGLVLRRWSWFDPKTPAGYAGTAHPEDVRRLKGKLEVIRSLDTLVANDSRVAKVGDYLSPEDRHAPDISTNVSYPIAGSRILSARPVDLSRETDRDKFYRYFDGNDNGYAAWAVLELEDASGFEGRDGTAANMSGPAMEFPSTIPGRNVQLTHSMFTVYLGPKSILVECYANPGGYDPSQGAATLTQPVTLENSSVGISKGSIFSAEKYFGYCKDLEASPWVNVPHLANEDLVRWLARQSIAATKPGQKGYFELSNEVWNNGFGQHTYYWPMGMYHNWLHKQDPIKYPFTYEGPSQYFAHATSAMRDVVRDEYSKAGRAPDDAVAILGSIACNGGVTEVMLRTLVKEKRIVDAVCVEAYHGSVPKCHHWDGPDLDGSYDRLDASGLIDVHNTAIFHGNMGGIVNLHRLLMNDNGHRGAKLFTYEDGFDGIDWHGTKPRGRVVFETFFHPRAFRLNLGFLSELQDQGVEISTRYMWVGPYNIGAPQIWTDLSSPFQDAATGSPGENPNPIDHPRTKSQLWGGRLAWISGGMPGGGEAVTPPPPPISPVESALAKLTAARVNHDRATVDFARSVAAAAVSSLPKSNPVTGSLAAYEAAIKALSAASLEFERAVAEAVKKAP